jgi:hypothetical protein
LQAAILEPAGEDEIERAGHARPVELAGLRARPFHQIGERVDFQFLRDRDDNEGIRHPHDRKEIAWLVGQLVVQERMRGERRRRRKQQHVIIMRGDEGVDGDQAVAAGPVLDDDRLPPFAAEPVGKQPGADIRTAARAKRQNEFYRARRPCRSGAGAVHQHSGGEQTQHQGQQGVKLVAHRVLPISRCLLWFIGPLGCQAAWQCRPPWRAVRRLTWRTLSGRRYS